MSILKDGLSSIVLDARFAPIYIMTAFGPLTEQLSRDYFAWSRKVLDEALRTKIPSIIISDATDAERPPPKVRAVIADLTNAMPPTGDSVQVFMVMPSALVRGALTAMQWVTRRQWPMQVVSTFAEAARRSEEALVRGGGRVPATFAPATYIRPVRP